VSDLSCVTLSRERAEAHLAELLRLDGVIGQDAWGEAEFLLPLPEKFDHSRLALGPSGEAVGFAVASRKGDCVHVHRLAVASSHQRRGIGLALLRGVAASGHGAGLETLTLKVARANADASRFYEALGFRPIGASAGGSCLAVATGNLLDDAQENRLRRTDAG
jgi:ribosomal protein S18 acetylase RimI-like enzyme